MSSSATPPLHDDRGLQPERTALTWERTVLSTLVLGCIVFRHPLARDIPMMTLMLMALCIGSIYSLLIIDGYRQSAQHIRGESSAPRLGEVLILGLGVAMLSSAALWGML
ncbi:protein of unknown function [Pseudomonas gessardii]|uniref:DUF202 domain-containing protein n=1 Tax=Pseudomonas TaxID=286 RepID=UPI000890A869|nr:DUF202 domain-containing protein [Pseudomonas gessardii]NNA69384.1 DUF202 domain-containing protein [Pseudomonas gessardii]NNA93461.1 DUF202 domain-containing protein [Pseudomonas gessardii]SDQ41360.1 protein of unknown function [Pseudomonas gessardii]